MIIDPQASSPMPQFLIVTPSYNQAQFLRKTVESVQAQGAANLIYWVMDGSSSDGSVHILQQAQKKWRGLQFISTKDRGQTDALNKGLEQITRSLKKTTAPCYFAYINSDDYYLPGAFTQVEAAFAAHPGKAWLVGDAVIVDQDGKPIQSWVQSYKKILRQLGAHWLLHILNPYPQPATFIRWEAVQAVGKFNEQLRYTMDYEFWQRLFAEFGSPILINQPLAAFRIHGQSKGGSQYPKQFAEELQVAQRYTKNPALLFAHKLHNGLIISVYHWIKRS
jgi:glycosyltransferase involved in cell wall biosynthesis